MTTLISCRKLQIERNDKTILHEVDLDFAADTTTAVMGPGGSGKSLLLKVLAGIEPSEVEVSGTIDHHGWGQPPLVPQKLDGLRGSVQSACLRYMPSNLADSITEAENWLAERLAPFSYCRPILGRLDDYVPDLSPAEKKRVAIASALASPHPVLMFDEPTARLDEPDAERVLELLAELSHRRTLLVVTHNQRQAKQIADQVVLIAGGRVVEQAPTNDFFDDPQHDATRMYVRTGGCFIPHESILVDGEPTSSVTSSTFVSSAAGPRGFHWLIDGKLGGCPQPGIVDDIDRDLEALRRCGTSILITLTEYELDAAATEAAGMRSLFFPIVDMEAPEFRAAYDLCRTIEAELEAGEVIVFHCKAGLGRTGTMLATYLVYQGASGSEALQRTRRAHPRWVQSREQEVFLTSFQAWLETNSTTQTLQNVKE